MHTPMKWLGITALAIGALSTAQATPFTTTSPTSAGALPGGVTEVGGIVLDLIGNNGNRVVSQLAADELFIGFCDSGTPTSYQGNPCTIGVQDGFTSSVTSALGGGISEAAVRITVDDGDTSLGNFDYQDNDLLLNGVLFGDWSDVQAQQTDELGNGLGTPSAGFTNNDLDTGFFYNTDPTTLGSLFTTLTAGTTISYQIDDVDPYDNFFDFTQGIDGSLINVGQGPTVTPGTPGTVPLPGTLALLGLGLVGVGASRRRS